MITLSQLGVSRAIILILQMQILRWSTASLGQAATFGSMDATKMGHSMWNDRSRYLTFSGTNSTADIAAGSFTSSGASWIAQLTGNGSQPTEQREMKPEQLLLLEPPAHN